MPNNIIFFDIDNTLLDDYRAKKDYLPRVYNKYEINKINSFADFEKNWFAGLNKYIRLYEAGKISFYDQQRIRFSEITGIENPTKNAVLDFYELVTDEYENSFCLFEDTIETLQRLKKNGHLLGIITNGAEEQQRKKIKKFNLEQFFSIVIISQEVGYSKPQKEIFEIAINTTSSQERNCFYVGDDYERDIIGSYNAGMNPIWINRESSIMETDSEISTQIHYLNELIEYFK